MNTVCRNISHSLSKNIRRNIVIFLSMALCTFVFFILLQNYYYLRLRHDDFFQSGNVASKYRIQFEDFDEEMSFMNDRLNKTPMFYVEKKVMQEIADHPDLALFDYMSSPVSVTGIKNPVDLTAFVTSDDFESDDNDFYDNPPTIDAEIISKDGFEAFHIKTATGRIFTDEDYHLDKSTPLPVVLGSEYQSVFKLGDIIRYEDADASDEAIVVGFLEEGSGTYEWEYFYSLDQTMLFPVVFPRTEESMKDEQGYTYIFARNESVDVQAVVNDITTKNGFYTLEVAPTDGVMLSETKTLSEKNVRIIGFLAVITTVVCAIFLGMVLYHRSVEDMPTNCIYMCCGIPLWKINISIILEMFMWICISLLPSIAISYTIYHALLIPLWLLFLYPTVVTAIALIPVFVVNKRCNLDMFIRNRFIG